MAGTSERQRVWTEAGALLGLSAGMRAAYAWAVPRMLDSADGIHYLETARLFARGEFWGVDPKIPALYPLLTAAVSLACSNIETAGQIVSFLFSVLLVLPVYFLSRRLHGAGAARIAGALVAVWPWLIDYSNRVATEPLAVFCWVTGVLCLVQGLGAGGRRGWMVAAAVFFFALHLARAEGTFVLFGALGAGVVVSWRSDWRPVGKKLLVYALTAGVLIAAHTMYLHELVGEWTLNYRVGFIGEQPEGSTVIAEFGRTLVAMTADVPAVMLGPLLWTFFGVGIAAPRKARGETLRSELIVLYFAAVQWMIVIPVLSPAPRYLMAAFVALSLWSARGIECASDSIRGRSGLVWVRHIPLTLVIAWMALHLSAAVLSEHRSGEGLPPQPWEYKIAGEWMRENLSPGPILTRKPQVGFYAEMPTIGIAADVRLDDIVAQAKASDARYLVVDERYSAGLVAALRPLLEPSNAPASMHVLRADLSPYVGGRVVIYELDRGSAP